MTASRPLRASVLAGLVVLGLAPLASGCSEPARAAAPVGEERTPVVLAPIERGPLARPITGGATLRSKRDYELAFQVGGVVQVVRVDVGSRVKKGQVLAALDPTTIAAGLSQAEESLAKATRDRARAEALGKGGVLPAAQVEDARSAAIFAEAAVATARFQARNTAIVAPEDGVVDLRGVEVGEVVSPGRPVFAMSGRSQGFVAVADLADRDAVRVKVGDAAKLELDALPARPLAARIVRIAQTAARGTGTFEIELEVTPEPGVSLLSGLTGRVKIEHQEPVAAAVPFSAVVDADATSGAVFVVDGERARRIPVEIAFLAGEKVALRRWEGGDAVVTRGAESLREGSLVKVGAAEVAR